jgi:NAD(P)H-hydrate epimerase
MENAGRGVAESLLHLDPKILVPLASQPNVEILCGKGNNGGDGFVIARHLEIRGVRCRTVLLNDPHGLTGDARTNYEILKRSDVPIANWAEVVAEWEGNRSQVTAETIRAGIWIIDALLGTGSSGDPRPPLDDTIRAMNRQPARRLAVDIPSGLDCDTGQPGSPTVRADHTCTFVARKQGFKTATAQTYTGCVEVIDIGTPPRLLSELAK